MTPVSDPDVNLRRSWKFFFRLQKYTCSSWLVSASNKINGGSLDLKIKQSFIMTFGFLPVDLGWISVVLEDDI